MKTGQLIRIVVALCIIFAAGVFTGRMTAPAKPFLISAGGGRTVSVDDLVTRMTAELGLDEAQRKQVRPLVEEMAALVAIHPAGSLERREILQRYRPRFEALLRPEQKTAFERFVEENDRRIERLRRRRGLPQSPTTAPAANPATAVTNSP